MQDYRGIVSFASTGWIQLPKEFFKITPTVETAVLLAWLINEAAMIQDQRPEEMEANGDWFRFSARKIQETMHISKNAQVAAVKKLEEKGLIATDRRGIPARRWVQICPDEIRKALENAQSSGNGTTSRPDSQSSRNGTTGRPDSGRHSICKEVLKELSQQSCDGHTDSVRKSRTKPREHHTQWAEKLDAAVRSVGGGNSRRQISSWADQFRLLEDYDGHDRALIQEVLDWYCAELPTRHGDKYFPVAYSGRSFREKFVEKLLRQFKSGKNGDHVEDWQAEDAKWFASPYCDHRPASSDDYPEEDDDFDDYPEPLRQRLLKERREKKERSHADGSGQEQG